MKVYRLQFRDLENTKDIGFFDSIYGAQARMHTEVADTKLYKGEKILTTAMITYIMWDKTPVARWEITELDIIS